MACPTFTNTETLLHKIDVLKLQSVDRNRIEYRALVAVLNFIRSASGEILDKQYPLEAVIESGPIFVNASTFPALVPNDWISVNPVADTNVAIEFRTASREDMRDATDWTSLSPRGASSNTMDMPLASFDGPFVTSPALQVVSQDTTRSNINWISAGMDAMNESAFYTSGDLTSSTDTRQAKYLVADFVSDRAGGFLEWHVNHGLVHPNVAIGGSDEPHRHIINIDKVNVAQRVFWDITDWTLNERNWDYIKVMSFKVIDASQKFNIVFDNIHLQEINDSAVAAPATAQLPVPVNRFIQYRVVMSSTVAGTSPELESVTFDFTHNPAILPNDMLRNGKCGQ